MKYSFRLTIRGQKMMNDQWPKMCPNTVCGGKYDRAAWRELKLLTNANFPDGRKRSEFDTQEYRNCVCGSTLTVITAVHKLDEEEEN